MNFQFQYPFLLWALAAIPLFIVIYLLNILWKRYTVKRIGNPRLVKELYKSHSSFKTFLKFFFIVLAYALGCIALANPRQPDETTAEARKGIDIVVALDISNSMLANDVKPNRLTQAKLLIQQLLRRVPDDRVGLVFFAGSAYVQIPLTFDHAAAEMIVTTAGPLSIKAQGTAVGDALQKSDLSFGEESRRFKSVVLISDGETHDENALQQAQEMAQKGIMINTVGIGSPGGASIIDTISGGVKKDLSGNVVVSKLNEELLIQLAAHTNGKYIRLNSIKDAANELALQLGQIEKRALGDTSLFNYNTFYMWLALPMLLLLLVEIFIPDRKKVAV